MCPKVGCKAGKMCANGISMHMSDDVFQFISCSRVKRVKLQ